MMIGDIIFLSNFLSSNCKVLGGASASRCSSTPRRLLLHRLQLLQTSSTTIRWRMHNRTKTGLILLRSGCNFHRLPPPQGDMEECTITPRLIIINIQDWSVLIQQIDFFFFGFQISSPGTKLHGFKNMCLIFSHDSHLTPRWWTELQIKS